MESLTGIEETFPPAGFVRGASQVDGIEVYLPGEQGVTRPELMDFKCPRCGGTTAYSVEQGKLACPYCGYSEAPEAQRVGRTAEQFEFVVETVERAQQGWGEARKELACQRCGGVVSTPPDALAFSCPFCGSNKVLVREPLEDVLRPRFLLPFQVDPQRCQEITREWLGSSWMLPAELSQSASQVRRAAFNALYIPFWTFEARANASWKAQVAHRTTEYYYDEKGQQQTREKVTWREESGRVQKDFSDLLVPGTTHLNLGALAKIDAYNLQPLVLYEPRYLAGMHAQAYDLPLDQAWDAGRQIMRERTRRACLDRASSSEVRNFAMTLDFADEKWRYILAPLYTAVYTFGEESYPILINGQNGKIAGPRPVDWQKVWLAIAALLLPGFLVSLIGLLVQGDAGLMTSGLGVILLLVGLGISFSLFRQAQGIENV